MKSVIILAAALLGAGTVLAADSDAADAIKGAAAKLSAADNYSWTMSSQGGRGGGSSSGKTEKNGYTDVVFSMRDNSIEAIARNGKGAIKTEDGWESLDDATKDDGGGGFNPARFIAMRMQNFKSPAAEAVEILDKTTGLTQSDGVYTGQLSEEGAKFLLVPWRRPGGEGPSVSDAKGSAKFWIKDGALTKYQYHVSGTVSFNGNDRDVDRTTTIEIKDVGTTKVTVPDEAKKKI